MKNWMYLSGWIVLSLILGVAYGFSLRATHPTESLLAVVNLSLSCIAFLFSVGAALFFISGLPKFKRGLRRAYLLLCVGTAVYGLAQAQIAILALTDAWWWAVNGLILLPYLSSVLLVFLGVRKLAGLLTVTTRWASLKWVFAASAVSAAAAFLLPYAPKEDSTEVVAITTALAVVVMVFFGFSAVAAWQVRKTIGPTYIPAMTRLCFALGATAVATFHYIVVQVVVPFGHWYYNGEMTSLPLFLASIVMLTAGYAIASFGSATQPLSSEVEKGAALTTDQMVEVMVYVAGLASKPQELDPILIDLRFFTSNMRFAHTSTAKAEVSSRDAKLLKGIYARLEHYLITSDPLRIFTKEGLRKEVKHALRLTDRAASQIWE